MAKPPDSLTKRGKAGVEIKTVGEAALVNVAGLIDEHFAGFGAIDAKTKALIIDVAAMTRMTSFGVRQWLKAIDEIPKTVAVLYLLGCPTFFVDQLNMVLNFGGAGKVLTVVAPYTCPSCGAESGEIVDILADRATLAKGGVPPKECSRCNEPLEFDETPESYFSFVTKYGASNVQAAAANLLSSLGLYQSGDTASDKPPRIIKLVHGQVTYFRIAGTIGASFRARPFLVGAEGELILDLEDVERFDPTGLTEWKRLLKTLAGQVPSITLVDVTESFLAHARETLSIARNIVVASVVVPYTCLDCGKSTAASYSLENASWPLKLPDQVCSVCGGTTHSGLPADTHASLQKASASIPAASARVIANRKELLSRAITDASVAQAGEGASAVLGTDDTVLGKYQIVRRLSAGGMAEVFLATQIGIGGFEKPVALKRILRQLLQSRHLAVDMFLNEAKIAGRLTHPNIVQVLDVGEEQGALFIAMEYVRGRDLRELLKALQLAGTSMPEGDACFIIGEVAQALHHAYWSTGLDGTQLSVVHRDVSPHNVMVGFDGSVKLLDFGVAMSSVTEHTENLVAGKWAYMSPEHTTNQKTDHRSDLFSLGVVSYLLFTGKMPFGGKQPREIVEKIRTGAYTPLDEIAPQVSPAIANLVSRMLAVKPEDRPQKGHEVSAGFAEIARSHGFNGSATSVAGLMSKFLGEESKKEQAATQRAAGSSAASQADSDSGSGRPGSSMRSTPTGISAQLDVSRALSRRSRDFPVQASPAGGNAAPIAAPPVAPAVAVAASPVAAAPVAARPVAAPPVAARSAATPVRPPAPSSSSRLLLSAVVVALVIVATIVMYMLVRPT